MCVSGAETGRQFAITTSRSHSQLRMRMRGQKPFPGPHPYAKYHFNVTT